MIAGSTLTLATAAEAEAGDRISGVVISSFEVANVMQPTANLADLGDKAAARGNLGLGSAAVENGAGTGPGEVLRLDESGKIPPIDASQVTGLHTGWDFVAERPEGVGYRCRGLSRRMADQNTEHSSSQHG